MTDAIFAVVRRNPGADAVPLFGGLFVASSSGAVDRVIEQTPNDARYFAGFVGWQAGELEKEIDAGYWLVADADPALFFRHDTGALWEELVLRLRVYKTTRLADSPRS
jgi:putative transcriptional regulator